MRVVGIAGGTASGKSTLARALAPALGATLIPHDAYYRTLPDHYRGERISEYNFDHPDALDNELLLEHLEHLATGSPIEMPTYDFADCRRQEHTITIEPGPVIIVEGILVFAIAELRERFHHRVFVDCPADIRLARRLRRDIVERGDEPESLLVQYLSTVRPMHEQLVQPSAETAHLRLDGRAPLHANVDAVHALIKAR